MKKRLGLDTSSFRKLREKDLVYVDKTKWIYKLITEGECYFLSRPRRFGKSLTISTLKELFYGNKELFEGLFIYDKWEFKKYPVVIFDFNEINNKTPKDLENSLRTLLDDYFEINKIKRPSLDDLSFLFKQLIVSLYQKFNQKVVILIDEYDKPIIDHLGKGDKELQVAIQNRDMLENFFGVLKGANVVDIIQFVFVTGVSRFSKVSIFSKWNNLQDITMRGEFADFLGYREEEVRIYFKDYLEDLAKVYKLTLDEVMEKLKFYYDGYRFSESNNVRVFNPVSIRNTINILLEENMKKNKLLERIEINPKVMVGKPVIKGTRLTVEFILNLLANGVSVEEILNEYKGLTKKDIFACLLFASRTLSDTEFMPLEKEVV